MLCKSCGKQLRDKATFCPYCGTKVEKEDADTEKEKADTENDGESEYSSEIVNKPLINMLYEDQNGPSEYTSGEIKLRYESQREEDNSPSEYTSGKVARPYEKKKKDDNEETEYTKALADKKAGVSGTDANLKKGTAFKGDSPSSGTSKGSDSAKGRDNQTEGNKDTQKEEGGKESKAPAGSENAGGSAQIKAADQTPGSNSKEKEGTVGSSGNSGNGNIKTVGSTVKEDPPLVLGPQVTKTSANGTAIRKDIIASGSGNDEFSAEVPEKIKNKMSGGRNTIIIAGAAVVVALVIIVIVFKNNSKNNSTTMTNTTASVQLTATQPVTGSTMSATEQTAADTAETTVQTVQRSTAADAGKDTFTTDGSAVTELTQAGTDAMTGVAQTAVTTAGNSIAGTSWVITSCIEGKEKHDMEYLKQVGMDQYTMKFNADGTAELSNGSQVISGTYLQDDTAIIFTSDSGTLDGTYTGKKLTMDNGTLKLVYEQK